AFAPDAPLLAAGDAAGCVLVWDAGAPGVKPREYNHYFGGVVAGLAFAPGGGPLAAGFHDWAATYPLLWQRGKPNRPRRLEGLAGAGGCLAFAPDGRTLAVGYGTTKV